jgi:hypothetical protein
MKFKSNLLTLTILALAGIFTSPASQNLPQTWSQSYGTFDRAPACAAGSYALGFSVNNYCLYDPRDDSTAYDERRFDIWARTGLFRNAEFELKYSSPTCAVVGFKYCFLNGSFFGAFKLGFGYMKGTRVNYLTDYIYDFYPALLLTTRRLGPVRFMLAPKMIYSIHQRDRQEHTTRPLRQIVQYGFGAGLELGEGFTIHPETNWLWADNEGVTYVVNQFGIGVDFLIR